MSSRLEEMEIDLPCDLKNVPDRAQAGGASRLFTANFGHSLWSGLTASNVLILENIERDSSQTSQPRTSEISLAIYRRYFPIEDLKYIFVTTVLNHQTDTYVRQCLYNHTPLSQHSQPGIWEYGTQEYEELLGTRIGRTVGYIMLGGFARGSRRITRILTWTNGYSLDLRFDVESLPSS